MYRAAAISVLAAAILVAGCGAPGFATANAGRTAWPAVLHYAVSVSQENPATQGARLEPIRIYLQDCLKIPVEITATSGYGAVIEGMRSHKLEAASMGPFAYLIASEKAGAEAIAGRGTPDGTPTVYAGMLAVEAGSPIHSIADLAAHAKQMTIGFVDPASASGYLVERVYLDSIGLSPENDFKKVVFSNNHLASMMALVAGKVDVAAISSRDLPAMIESGKLRNGEIRTIWTSPGIPDGPITVRKDLPADFKKKLQQALREMPAKAPEAYKNMAARLYQSRYLGTTLVATDDSLFAPLRNMARGVKQVQLLEH
jgi:phosphonate transport system substrate-binding protein